MALAVDSYSISILLFPLFLRFIRSEDGADFDIFILSLSSTLFTLLVHAWRVIREKDRKFNY